jgi:hypothetical protein
MSELSRSQAPKSHSKTRRNRRAQVNALELLEGRCMPAPVVTGPIPTATFIPATTPTLDNLGTVEITTTATTDSALAFTSVAQLTSAASFGGDIVRIEAGPGGDFGKGVYAISRGAGENANDALRSPGIPRPINRPGVIYRVDPATGKTSVFFDLNTVINQIDPGENASNGGLPSTGLQNWYDMTFDPEGYFDGKPSLFVTSLSDTNPTKNAVFRIGPDGSFMGVYIRFTAESDGILSREPSAILAPPPQQQQFLRGLLVGDAGRDQGFNVLFFNANAFRPGTALGSATTLPPGVTSTALNFGPQTGLISANNSYASLVYSTFADFGPVAPIGQQWGAPGLSGVQGLSGELLINLGTNIVTSFTDPNFTTVDTSAAITTPFRRFQDIAFDYFGYFSYGTENTRPYTIPPTYVGSLFVADLATGLSVSVSGDPLPPNTTVIVPVQGPGPVAVTTDPTLGLVPVIRPGSNNTTGSNIGGRIIRIDPDGTIHPFASGFKTSGSQLYDSFENSSLSISFSADGTILYASDDDGIWQFKTVTSLAGATSGSLVGLNDLRSLGIPYEGQDLAVAVIDTGIDARTPNFRGRVAEGHSVFPVLPGNDDTAAADALAGHGTPLAGVIAQFVPQATLVPINVFTPNQAVPGVTGGTTPQAVWQGLKYAADKPFVKDPIRPNTVNRVIAAAMGFGTESTFFTEATAFRQYPQLVVAMKQQFRRQRLRGIQPIAAAGQLGIPIGGTQANANFGDTQGMSIAAVLNEVISVTGSYTQPFTQTARTSPIDEGTGVIPRPVGTILAFGDPPASNPVGPAAAVSAGDLIIFKDKILVAANRNYYTDFTAPAIDVPTFQRTPGQVDFAIGTQGGYNVFQEGGTSISAGVLTGSYALVASAIDYWTGIVDQGGFTVDGYLTTPIGVNQLNFGPHGIIDLSLYSNPDAINSILQWTAVPVSDEPNTLDDLFVPTLVNSAKYRQISRVDVGNAIAAIEGSIALNYLFDKNLMSVIDGNSNGLITAEEIQVFVDQSAAIGMPEAGALARFLGGTARIPTTGFQVTGAGENPDQPNVLQRRYNFFDYAADGQLNGVISIDQYKMLAHRLMPSPDAFVVTDRQRASQNGYLLSPNHIRNYADLKQLKPSFVWVSPGQMRRFSRAGSHFAGHLSPNQWGVGRRTLPSTITPLFTLFEGRNKANQQATANSTKKNRAADTPPTAAPSTSTVATSTTAPAATDASAKQSSVGEQHAAAVLDALKKIAQGGSTTTATAASSTTAASAAILGTPRPIGESSTSTNASSTVAATSTSQTTEEAAQSKAKKLTAQQKRAIAEQQSSKNKGPFGIFKAFDNLFG